MITLQLLAIDFHRTRFSDGDNCAISKAIKRQLNTGNVSAGCRWAEIENVEYKFQWYGKMEFDQDQEAARLVLFSDTDVIRTIELTPAK